MNPEKLEKALGIKFDNPAHLKKALVHRSYLNETEDTDVKESNERLEFLGDAILQFLSSEFLFTTYPAFGEGDLTNLRSKIVNTEALAGESKKLNIPDYLLISRGERQTAYVSSSILANTFEAILGAIYLDKGLEECRKFLNARLFYLADEILQAGHLKDAKSLYQELSQENHSVTPTYRVIEDQGPDHNKTFTVGVFLNDKLVATGTGPAKKTCRTNGGSKCPEKESK